MKDKVWFTYKARIQAARRLSRNDFHSQALLVWYAFLSAALAVVSVRYPQVLGADTDLLAAILGIGLLVMSMFVTNQDFRGRAIAMRSNYIAMQALHDATDDDHLKAEQVDKYGELLAAAENHTEMDDKRFRVFQRGVLTRPATNYDKAEVFASMAVRAGILTLLYSAPLALIVYFACR